MYTKKEIKIISWNVNSINARLPNIERFIFEQKPDIIMLQELRCVNSCFPYQFFDDMHYNVIASCQKSRNGVAIASVSPIEDIFVNLIEDDNEARYIECCTNINGFFLRLACVYVPNGGSQNPLLSIQYKMTFLEKLRKHLIKLSMLDEVFIIGGDFNIAPEIGDVFDHHKLKDNICFSIDEREAFRNICESAVLLDGWRIMNYNVLDGFSWWDYRHNSFELNHGMRIDNFLLSPQAADHMYDAKIYRDVRTWQRASDHVPISVIVKQ